ncbi:MAG: gyrA [Candidatus Berkelbacteria bacterium]|nr:gyrA [Candidatus Berkelbacteria bacterium]
MPRKKVTKKADETPPENSEKTPIEDLADLSPEKVAQAEITGDFSGNGPAKEEKTEFGLVRARILEDEMRESYLDYAMSVIIARALPDVRDGLKPVHRRVLFSMFELGLTHQAKFRKSATVVGDVLGKYHPHGDIAVYDTLVRLAQPFSMRERLVDGQGNFGSLDGDAPAAMRYTESRLTSVAEEILSDLDKNTVDFVDNYDATRKEPKVLPAKVPNLLINGSMGIAVGMATNIPPHNLGEVCDAVGYLIDDPECTMEDLMVHVKGPDFPTGAEIYGIEQIKAAYATGKGAITMRAVANIEDTQKGFRIIVSEIPYQVNKAELITKIADLVREKKLEGISDLRDESDRKEGVRIVIDLKSSAYPKKILNRLYELTDMQTVFYTNMLALVDGIQPRILTLKNVLEEYLKHRQNVVRRRTKHLLDRAKERAHVLEGLRIALKSIDDVVSTIRKSKDRNDAHKALKTKFKLTDIQSNAILDMRLSALAALEREKIESEYEEKLRLIADLESILGDEKKIIEIIKKELKEMKDKYASPRRTKIYAESLGKFSAEDLIPSEQVIIILTRGNYIKRMPVSSYRSQVRGGKGVMGMETKEEDMIEHLVAANTHDDMFFFTDRGRIFHTKVYEIPSASRIAKGQAIVNILQISPEEKVTAMITLTREELERFKYILLATSKGLVKKSALNLYSKVRKTGILAIKLKNDDRLRWVKFTTGDDNIFQVSAKGQSIFYRETDIRPMGRTAAGVRGIHLKGEDYAVSCDVIATGKENEADALIVMEKGFGKRTPLVNFKMQLRGGMGIRAAQVTPRTGEIIGMRIVYGIEYDVILASSKGQMIRMAIGTIKRLQRDTQGVTLIRLNKGDKVTSVTVIKKDKGDKLIDVPEEPKGPIDDSENKSEPTGDLVTKVEEKSLEPKEGILKEESDNENISEKIAQKPAEKKLSQSSIAKKENQPEIEKEETLIEGKLPDWAKVHTDTWRQPDIFKLKKDIKVHDYKEKNNGLPLKDSVEKDLSSEDSAKEETNYWGKKH